MENIYGQTELERNSIVELPDGFAKNAGDTLYSWLGSLWRGLHKGDGMVRGLQASRGIRLAQLYLDILEAVRLQDRNGAPVFHRELWHPIVVRGSKRDTAQENMLTIGANGVLGPQQLEDPYGVGTVLRMGRLANFADYVTYPVDAKIAGGALTIVDNIVNPTVFLESGTDFVIRNGSIIFHRDNDPLGDDSKFDRYDVVGWDPENPDRSDMEAVLWASDVLIDKNYVSEHISYALGADSPSSDVVKRILNAAWSSVASGLTPELIRTLMAAMLNVPVIQNETETVVDIATSGDGIVVHTDCGEYRISPKARLLGNIGIGTVLKRGDFLDESLRMYQYLNVASAYETGYSVPVELDVPSVVMSPSILRARTEYGVYAMWGKSVVKKSRSSPLDANGNPHLYFDVGGMDSDVSAFWSDVWKSAEDRGTSMADIIGQEGSLVSPAAFFMKHLVGANTLFVVVDKSQIDDTSMMRNPMFFDMLSDVVPSAMRLFLVEHSSVGEDDRMDMGGVAEPVFVAAALPKAMDCVSEGALPGMEGRAPSFGERISLRFIRPSPAKVRGHKEEER